MSDTQGSGMNAPKWTPDFDPDEGYVSEDGMSGIAPGAMQLMRVELGEYPPESLADPNSPNYSRHWRVERGENGELRRILILDGEVAEAIRKSEENWEAFYAQFGEALGGFDGAWWLYAAVSNISRSVKEVPGLGDYIAEQMFKTLPPEDYTQTQ